MRLTKSYFDLVNFLRKKHCMPTIIYPKNKSVPIYGSIICIKLDCIYIFGK
jgi:hypothetical protein